MRAAAASRTGRERRERREGAGARRGRDGRGVGAALAVESVGELLRGAEAIGGELLQGGEHRVLDGGRHGVALGARAGAASRSAPWRRWPATLGPVNGRLAGEHLVGHGAERVDVAARADVALAHRLLGAHVGGRAERHAGLGHAAAAGLLHGEGDAEVGDEGAAVVQEDVLGLDVAVDDALAVGVVEGAGDFRGDADGVVDGELLLAGRGGRGATRRRRRA